MPLTFSIDHEARTVLSTATGILSRDDLLGHLLSKKAQKLFSYSELFDVRNVTLDLSISDLHKIAAEARLAMGDDKPERVAVVTTSSFIRGLAHTYAALTVGENPNFSVFQHIDEARQWVYDQKN